ncbi:MAG: HAMP domain-containing protein [Magnetococcales bacterium]|nr:HAMP domain-containing protein [Magnetococcales bacterium]
MNFMLDQLKNITFTKKLTYLIFMLFIKLVIVVGTLGWMFWLNQQEIGRWQSVDQLSELAWDVMAQLHELNEHVHQYILHHKDDANREWVEQNIPKVYFNFNLLMQEKRAIVQSTSTDLKGIFQKYTERVQHLFKQVEQYGVTHESGIYGEMRDTIHKVEILLESHPVWGLQLLQIRRAEKDFMLRMEEGYKVKLNQRVNALLTELSSSKDANREEMTRRLIEYRDKFQELSSLTLAIQGNIQAIYALWEEMSGEVSLLRTGAQEMREAEHIRYKQVTHYLSIAFLVGIVLILVITGVLLSIIFHNNILKPIRQLTNQAQAIAQGKYDCDISLSGRDEIGVLASHLQQMKESLQRANRTLEQRVEERTRSLTQSNTELRESLAELKQTRDELVQSEKAALLGRLVAGFAHEINTPIGIGVGSISALPEYVSRLETLLAADEVNGDLLDQILAKIREMSNLCLVNLRNVSDLVTRFKRTSVDQTSEYPRRFNVHEFLSDVVSTLQHMIKRSSVEIMISCPTDLVVQSQPGALGQVLTNLLINSFKHGFDEGKNAGIIHISVQYEAERRGPLVIWYSDNGKGIVSEVLDHIFEPFFSTAKGRGGSGLGLYICYNIVRNQLMGKMVCCSIPGQETSFLIEIPVTGGDDGQKNYS